MGLEGWSGRVDPEGELALRWHQIVRAVKSESHPGTVLIGFSCDEGVQRNQGRPGAVEGPHALRRVLSNLPSQANELIYDAGDVSCQDGNLEKAQFHFAGKVAELIGSGHFVIGLGGGHEIAFGSYLGLVSSSAVRPGQRIGVLNTDAHFDLRDPSISHSGNSFSQAFEHARANGIEIEYCALGISESSNTALLFEQAKKYQTRFVLDNQLDVLTLKDTLCELRTWISSLDHLYFTICLDVLPASVAPGVSAPAARGMPLEILERIVEVAASSRKLRVADIAEFCPRLDIDQHTARVASRLVWTIVKSQRLAKLERRASA